MFGGIGKSLLKRNQARLLGNYSAMTESLLGSATSRTTFSTLEGGRPNFAEQERKVLQFWRDIDAFNEQLRLSKDKKPWNFYDGPPFATGKPHYGHILAGTIKDVVCRYATQTGHFVERRFGWDTHGLPVEFEIEKKLGIETRDDVMQMGIDNYNAECRAIVMRCRDDWESTVERMGRWIDFVRDYKTLDTPFMESVWWVFSEMHRKGLVYRGYKVMPYSCALNTPLSNFEAKSNYKERMDPAVIVNFPVVGDEDTRLLAWTTTPWTLPSNLALCVNAELDYVKCRCESDGKLYIFGVKCMDAVKKGLKGIKLTEVERMKGKDLVGIKYHPLFDYFGDRAGGERNNFRVLSDGYVGETEGTAIVHQAPGFGEDDFRVCEEHGIYQKGEEVPCPVDHSGRYTEPVNDFIGRFVLDCNSDICKQLKNRGRLWSQGTLKHEYPHCWRSEKPLIYRAIPSWFIDVTQLVPRLLANNDSTQWVPAHVKEKRFHNWLESARDWAVSRNRYWGTPLPIWISEDCSEWCVIGSVEELEKKAKLEPGSVTDLHRHNIDHIEIVSEQSGKTLRRVDEVFDCWFESGSMPYAQAHYPFDISEEEFLKTRFPADFIAEGLDQTRGWFYTLLVISTALFDKPAWQNLIVNGLVLAEDGKKMSKRLKNYPDPNLIFDKYGADALRLYLCNSPVVRAESLNFSESGVASTIRDVLSPWFNAYKFFIENANRFERESGRSIDGSALLNNGDSEIKGGNVMDAWILSELQSLITFVRAEMEGYRLYTVVPELCNFIDNLCNWYVRMNRLRIRGQLGVDPADTEQALNTMYLVLYDLSRLMAPLTPFIAETMYQNLKLVLEKSLEDGSEAVPKSVHFLDIPVPNAALQSSEVERRVRSMKSVIETGRNVRDKCKLKNKQPLSECIVVHPSSEFLSDVEAIQEYILTELNVKSLKLSSEMKDFIRLTCEPIQRSLGKKFGKRRSEVVTLLKALSHEELYKLSEQQSLTLTDESGQPLEVTTEDVEIIWNFSGDSDKYGDSNNGGLLVLLNKAVDRDLFLEGLAREVSNRIQKMRKAANLTPEDKVTVYYDLSNSVDEMDDEDCAVLASSAGDSASVSKDLSDCLQQQKTLVESLTRVKVLPQSLKSSKSPSLLSERFEIESDQITLTLCPSHPYLLTSNPESKVSQLPPHLLDSIEYYLLSKHYDSFVEEYGSVGSKMNLEIDGTPVELVCGRDYVLDPMCL